ncbi:hypothetical protein PV08_11061 [Exophiala spinifera]|uniref:Low temperature requirement A n=1 Tax=Exophiala spinifera TaxID=91928 RepID=A0A0D1Y5A0_9EURO|nr:uncharacterized protein PV08_11061 [Exophiala spinifera]KIW10101.1 hypothetical protein PV08_11061 [Exophiala spinifera]
MSTSQLFRRRQSAHDGIRRKTVRWIASPLESSSKTSGEYALSSGVDHKPAEETDNQSISDRSSLSDDELPHFRHDHESSKIELFYDLFLVANLTSFTTDHEIINGQSLRNYVGFFAIVWFTWLETSLFDVRFAADSVFTRICKAIAFAAMTGIAACGANYNTGDVSEHLRTFRSLSIILMCSRLALAIQYIVVLLYVRKYPRTRVPLLSTIATLFLSAMAFLGTFFAFNLNDESTEPDRSTSHSGGPPVYISHYIIVCVEAIGVITISCIWRSISFKKTHLVERIGLLTLIIMGEGIIGITRSISKVLQNSVNTSGSVFGITISAVLLLYFVWILYFDQIDHDRFGTIRQQVWAILHFPLHTALILVSEGNATLILWKVIMRYLLEAVRVESVATHDMANSTNDEVVEYLQEKLETFTHHFKHETLYRLGVENFVNDSLSDIRQISANDSSGRDEYIGEIRDSMFDLVFAAFGIEVDEGDATWEPQLGIFWTVLYYYYIAAGVFAVLLAVLYWFGKTKKSREEWVSIVLRLVVGIGLCTTTAALLLSDTPSTSGFILSAWTVTVIMLAYFVIIILDNLLDAYANHNSARRRSSYVDTNRRARDEQVALAKATKADVTAQGESIKLRLLEASAVEQADRQTTEDPQSSRSFSTQDASKSNAVLPKTE